jgi:hypothetical protein
MLRIDRVSTELDVVSPSASPGSGSTPPDASVVMADPRTRERIKELVREALSEQLRELERRGIV